MDSETKIKIQELEHSIYVIQEQLKKVIENMSVVNRTNEELSIRVNDLNADVQILKDGGNI